MEQDREGVRTTCVGIRETWNKTEGVRTTCVGIRETWNKTEREYVPPVLVSEGGTSGVGRMFAVLPAASGAMGVLRVDPNCDSLSRCCSWEQRETSGQGSAEIFYSRGQLKNISKGSKVFFFYYQLRKFTIYLLAYGGDF